jgi:hypothetical protein
MVETKLTEHYCNYRTMMRLTEGYTYKSMMECAHVRKDPLNSNTVRNDTFGSKGTKI